MDGTAVGRRGRAVALVLLVAGWSAVTLAGWSAFHATGGGRPGAPLPDRALGWAVAVPVAVALGLLVVGLVEHRYPLPRAEGLAVLAAAGWGLATAVGWTIDVRVGGPATGLVTGSVLVAAGAGGRARLPLLLAMLAGTSGLVAGSLVAGEGSTPLHAVAPLTFGLVAFGAVALARGGRLPWLPVAGLTVGWGVTWVLAYLLSQPVMAATSATVGLGGEMVGACTVGGALTAWAWRRRTGESVPVVTARWAGCAVAGVGLGAAVAVAAFSAGLAPAHVQRPLDLLAAGTTLGLGLAAGAALLPTLRRLAPDGTGPHG